ncbi:putative fad binding domain protein [Diplodia seriata]|uniref:Putative fad binding domain protein n=1 Tax=Diplodia seriata TaxID=420778 RepID=A0A0G2DQE8_9PEZI|nr:putative fad binding domain protein [Diplodia seriata]
MGYPNFRVAIVGGSIAGLTLALALEKSGIDFVVLEAYPEIAPQVGASIAVLPNGFRILDQLGCYEDLLKLVNCTIDNFIIRDSDDDLPVQYRCLFGISEKVPGIAEDTLHHVTNTGSSLFAASGPNDRTYWCLFVNTGTTYHGSDLPPFDAHAEAATVRAHAADAVTETVTFDALYTRKLTSVCTPVHEYVLGTWHSRRCMVVGDAAHKFNPIIGLGGMSAIETAAALSNALSSLLLTPSSAPPPVTAPAIAAALASTQALRHPRATALVAASQQTQHRFAMETAVLAFLNRLVYPAMGAGAALRLLSEAYPGALFGLATVLPLYVLVFFNASQGVAYWMPAERCVPQSVSKVLLPALILGFLLPSVLMVVLGAESQYIQEVIAAWQLTPVLVSPLSVVLSKLQSRPASLKESNAPVEDYQGLDMPHLKRLYDVLFFISAAVHVTVLAVLGLSSDMSIAGAFVPVQPTSPVSTVAAGMKIFFQFDLLMTAFTMFVWLVLNVWDMKRVGIVALPALKTVGVLLLGNLLVGPGATLVAFWKWREETMAHPALKKS